jgi:hypothetical protein
VARPPDRGNFLTDFPLGVKRLLAAASPTGHSPESKSTKLAGIGDSVAGHKPPPKGALRSDILPEAT